MEIFLKKTFDTWSIFEEELEAFCDEHHIIIRKEDCKLFNETDLIYKTFKYQFVKYECVHAGKPRENKKDNSRKDQSSQAIGCPFKFRIRYDKKSNKLVFSDAGGCMQHNHPVSEFLYRNHPLTKQKKLFSNDIATELITDLIITKADKLDANF